MRALFERFMDRHRGRRTLLGWLVFQADIRWLNGIPKAAKRIASEP